MFARRAFAPGLLPYIVGAICLAPLMHHAVAGSRLHAMAVLAGAGLFFLTLSSLLSFVLLATQEERETLKLKLASLQARFFVNRSIVGFPPHVFEPKQ